MLKWKTGILMVLMACGALAAAHASTAVALKDIPIYPGAVRDATGEKLLIQKGKDDNSKQNDFVSFDALRFTTRAAAEDVLLWYLQTYGLSLGTGAYGRTPNETFAGPGITVDKLKSDDLPGSYSQMGWRIDELHKYLEGDADSSMTDYMLAMYAANRKQVRSVWVRNAFLFWSCIENDGNITSFTITISDSSFEKYTKAKPAYDQKCAISFVATTSLSPGNIAKAAHAAQAQASAAAPIPAGEPTAGYLGVPVYPGARFAAAASKDGQAQGQAFFAWVSNDPVEAIVAFYEKVTGLKRSTIAEGAFGVTKQLEKGGGIVVAVFPAKDVAVNDPFIQAAKTAFSIVKF